MTSQWARWRPKSQASQLFTQPLIPAQIKETIKAPCHWPLSPVNSPHKWPVTRKMFPFDVIIMHLHVWLTNWLWDCWFINYRANYTIIQIKICAEYRDMLTWSRLVGQEPRLRPIGRSPGVPDKSSRGLGSMSRYSAHILVCFIAYISHCFYSTVGLIGNFAGLPPCTVPSAIAHRNQNEAAHQTIKSPSMPCWSAATWKHSGNYATELIEIGR